jgi:poly(3-hydroxybutyrate) depolymerase
VPKGKPAGLIMVLPGGGESPERVMNQIYLDELSVAKNLIVVFPGLKTVISKWRPSGNSWTALQKIW